MPREQHLKAIHVIGFKKIGKSTVLMMMCADPKCAGVEVLARLTVGEIWAEANAHIDKMESLREAVRAEDPLRSAAMPLLTPRQIRQAGLRREPPATQT